MNKTDKIFIAGAAGMVGSALVRKLLAKGYTNLIGSCHSRTPDVHAPGRLRFERIDLLDQESVRCFFNTEKPDHVFLAAARVGGIHANNTYPARFIHDNLVMQSNVIHGAYENRVRRLLFLGSSCIYPRACPQPMTEDHLLTGLLEPTNEPYAIAKISGIKMCEAYNRQYGTQFIAVMPTNLYGPNDNFDLETSHVLPALIRKFHEAKTEGAPSVTVWGTGTPRREFLHVDDMADGCIHVMNLSDRVVSESLTDYPAPCFVNLGTGKDLTILELAERIRSIVGFEGDLVFDASRPDGTMVKRLDVSRMDALGWSARISLTQGIKDAYAWYLRHLASTGLEKNDRKTTAGLSLVHNMIFHPNAMGLV
ncbi:GDP-L-fucose synthase [Desulfatiferula olefinivorans]